MHDQPSPMLKKRKTQIIGSAVKMMINEVYLVHALQFNMFLATEMETKTGQRRQAGARLFLVKTHHAFAFPPGLGEQGDDGPTSAQVRMM